MRKSLEESKNQVKASRRKATILRNKSKLANTFKEKVEILKQWRDQIDYTNKLVREHLDAWMELEV